MGRWVGVEVGKSPQGLLGGGGRFCFFALGGGYTGVFISDNSVCVTHLWSGHICVCHTSIKKSEVCAKLLKITTFHI